MPVDEQTARSVYRAYVGGQMAPEERAEYEADVAAGTMSLPQGAQLLPPADVPFDVQAQELPAEVAEAFQAGRMTPEEEAELSADVAAGRVRFPVAPPEEPTIGEQVAGAGEAALTMATGATGGTLGMIGGTLKGLAEELISGQFGTPAAAERIERRAMEAAGELTYAPRTEAGQEIVETIGEATAPLVAVAPLAETAAITRAATRAPAAKEPATAVRAVTEKAQRVAATPEGRRLIEARPQTGKLAAAADTIKRNPYDPEAAGFRLIGNTAVEDSLANAAIKQGFRPGVVASIKASTPEDARRMLGMVNIHKLGQKSEIFRAKNRPADVIGKTISDQVKFLAKENKQAGREVNRIAQTLRGQRVDYRPAMTKFMDDLSDIGVTLEPKKGGGFKAILRGSDVEGDKVSKALLNRVLTRLGDTDVPDAYGVHRAKQYIDTQVEFGKRAKTPLSAKTERVVKDLRRGLNESLREFSPEYRAANERFAATRQALDDFRGAVGSKVDLDSPNVDKALGASSRKLLSNAPGRIHLADSLDKLERVARQYGYGEKSGVMPQVVVANEIDRMFGAAAPTSLKGQLAQALQTGVEAARSSAADNMLNLARIGLEKARGINEENAIKALEALLKRESGE